MKIENGKLKISIKPIRFLKPYRFLCLALIFNFQFSILHSQNLDFAKAQQALEKGSYLEAYLYANQAKPVITPESNLAKVYQASTEYLSIVEQLTTRIIEPSEKQLFYQLEFESYELMIEVCERLYTATNDNKYIETAFQFAEKNRNVLLFNTLGFGNNKLSDSLKTIEGEYLSQIALLKDSLELEKKRKSINENRIDDLENRRDKQQLAYSNFLLENQAQKKPVKTVDSIKTVQKNIAKDEAFVIYFYGKKAIYAFVITKKDKSFFKIQTNKIPAEISEMIYSVVDNLHSAKETEAVQTLHELYNLVFRPIIKKIGNRKKLHLVADGSLSVLPFDALLTEKVENWDYNFSKLPFLIFKYQITYQHSATTFIQQKKGIGFITNPKMELYAPKFENTSIDGIRLNNLKQSKSLIQQLKPNWRGSFFENKTATLNQLKSQLNHHVLHFATHTLVDDEVPLNSKIILADGFLSLDLLYQTDLKQDLAVLGSCRTGSGKYQVGVGRVGMAYGFHLAGVKSLVYSLWEVDETATNRLLLAFYDNLKKGLPKDEALHQAKINYLKNANETTADPYYWAGFVLQGETSGFEFEEKTSWNFWVWVVFGFLVIGGLWYFWRG